MPSSKYTSRRSSLPTPRICKPPPPPPPTPIVPTSSLWWILPPLRTSPPGWIVSYDFYGYRDDIPPDVPIPIQYDLPGAASYVPPLVPNAEPDWVSFYAPVAPGDYTVTVRWIYPTGPAHEETASLHVTE